MDIYRRIRTGLVGILRAPLAWVPCIFSLVVMLAWRLSLPSPLFREPYSHVLVDRDGNIRYLHKGYKPGYEEAYQEQVRALIRE